MTSADAVAYCLAQAGQCERDAEVAGQQMLTCAEAGNDDAAERHEKEMLRQRRHARRWRSRAKDPERAVVAAIAEQPREQLALFG